MTGEQAEVRRFAEILQEALNVLGPAKVSVAGPDDTGLYGLTVNRDEGIRQGRLVQLDDWPHSHSHRNAEPSLQTVMYMHTLESSSWEEGTREILSYHWHGGIPHVHVHGGKEHIETGRVTVEALIRYCIKEAGWAPTTAAWEGVLEVTSAHFDLNHRWT